jgi:hypothetical protein
MEEKEFNREEFIKKFEEAKFLIDALIDSVIKPLKEIEEKKFYSTIAGFESENDLEKFSNICSDIALKDESFHFDVNRDMMEVEISDINKDKLHKRSLWLVKKTGIPNIYYKVK